MDTQNATTSYFSLEGELTIHNAVQIRDELLVQLGKGKEIEINLQHVSELDTAGVQLLLMVKREAVKLGKTLHFVQHSKAALEVLDLLNIVPVLGDPLVLTSPDTTNRKAQ